MSKHPEVKQEAGAGGVTGIAGDEIREEIDELPIPRGPSGGPKTEYSVSGGVGPPFMDRDAVEKGGENIDSPRKKWWEGNPGEDEKGEPLPDSGIAPPSGLSAELEDLGERDHDTDEGQASREVSPEVHRERWKNTPSARRQAEK